jgi:uroporphyrinogen-III decarboxylase
MIIDIDIEYSEVEQRQARWEKAMRFQFADRVPVLHYLGARYWLPRIGMGKRYRDYLNDPRTMLEAQLLGAKWIFENVDSDYHKVVCYPDFMWVEDAEPFGARILYPEDDSPWVNRPFLLEGDDDLSRLRDADYVKGGIHGRILACYEEMKKAAADFTLRFKDGKTLDATDLVYIGGGIIGPLVIAGDLRGADRLALDFTDRPEFVNDLLDAIVQKSVRWIDATLEASGGRTAFASDFHPGVVFIGDDGTAQMSPRLVREFALKPLKTLADHIHGKGLKVMAHNCGKADHLLEFWIDDVKIDRYVGFSYLTDKRKIREIMGGRATLIGGISPACLHGGTAQDVREDVRNALEILKDVPGYALMDGHNVSPGTPVENLNAVTAAAREYGSF